MMRTRCFWKSCLGSCFCHRFKNIELKIILIVFISIFSFYISQNDFAVDEKKGVKKIRYINSTVQEFDKSNVFKEGIKGWTNAGGTDTTFYDTDDSICSCASGIPYWNDTCYGRDEVTKETLWRKKEIDYEMSRYRLLLPKGGFDNLNFKPLTLNGDSQDYKFIINVTKPKYRKYVCGEDTFYSTLTGPIIQQLQFVQKDGGINSTFCEYVAIWKPYYPGNYTLKVWLTYTNGTGYFQPSHLQPVLEPYREALKTHLGRLKDIDKRFQQLNLKERLQFGMPMQLLENTPKSFHVNIPPKNDRKWKIPFKKINNEDTFCDNLSGGSEDSIMSGMFIHRDVCSKNVKCRNIMNSTIFTGKNENLTKYIWTIPSQEYNLHQYISPENFHFAINGGSANTSFRVLFVGDSLQREDFSALRQFLREKSFYDLDSRSKQNQKPFQTRGIYVEYLNIDGFYETLYGWEDELLGRRDKLIDQILNRVKDFDLIIWNDAGHSLEKNDVKDVLVSIEATAQKLLTKITEKWGHGKKSLVFRLMNYVHALGPLHGNVGQGHYVSSALLQAPRIEKLNHQTKNILHSYGISTFDNSHPHAARPEATRDKMHWGRYPVSRNAVLNCNEYCNGQWATLSFDEYTNALPILAFSTIQM